MDIEQQRLQRLCPLLTVLFKSILQFTQVMTIAQGVPARRVTVVRFPVVVAEYAAKLRQNAHRVHRLLAAFGVNGIMRELGITSRVQPDAPSLDMDAGFIGVQQRLAGQPVFQSLFKRRQSFESFTVEARQRAG